MSPLSTTEVATKAGIDRATLERWIAEGNIAPRTVAAGKRRYRIWTASDVARVRAWKVAHYRKGRGRKKLKLKSGQGRRSKRRTLP